MGSCNSEPSLQKYFVENSEKKDFIALDISPNILNVDKTKLSAEQNEALNSFDKMNILAFKADQNNQTEFETERNKVKAILKDPKSQELMKFGSGKEGASVSYVGSDDNIKEFVIFANRKENGFAVVRVLGEDMNPNNIMTLMSVLQNSKIDMEQLKPLEQLLKK
ncbi:putative lipoprotein [Flavobacterium anhuiense]|uniref:Putative lipoprotein n=1 Tax=Flavobacterium anhuiense TaxID=459526 RepID=A0A444VVQ7_9FLAO|nr:putative lipoprotein [Flavobacterium anhuiense]